MNEDIKFLVIIVSCSVVVSLSVMVYLHRGRKSGRVGPKLAAPLITLFYAAVPFIGIPIFLKKGSAFLYPQYVGIGILTCSLLWLAVYIGPFGVGWMDRWDDYVYPSRKKGGKV
ncbi:hypothetical protein ACFLUU_02740 [Chloroflexota bacterium]